ncbi:MAG: YibE/F family protein [Candidatus Margulisiibacteriota bacterium]
MKKTLAIFFAVISLCFVLRADAAVKYETSKFSYEKGRIISAVYADDNLYTQRVSIKVLSGKFKGRTVSVNHMTSSMAGGSMVLKEGDNIIVYAEENPTKAESPDGSPIIQVDGFQRDTPLIWLAILFASVLVLTGGLKGLKSLISLILTIALIFFVLIPLTLRGINPILVTCFISAVIAAVVFRIVGGNNLKSLSGAIGTVLGVTAAGLIAVYAGSFMNLTGLSSEESLMLMYSLKLKIDFVGLLFSGVIIGALGAVMDVGMSIASAIEEVRRVRPGSSFLQLFNSGMNVGKDVMGTMSNTLILAYVGASLPLIILFISSEMSFVKIANMELIAEEVLRALSGSIGLILCIPITAFISALLFFLSKKKGVPSYEPQTKKV